MTFFIVDYMCALIFQKLLVITSKNGGTIITESKRKSLRRFLSCRLDNIGINVYDTNENLINIL